PELMSHSDLFVLCSHNEGLAYVILETMYAELLIISTAVGGVPDIVKHGETGFLVARNDDAQLRELIEKCITNTNIRQSIVKRAREVAEQKYSIAGFSSQYNTVLRELCKI
ncbi:MAG: glycosyltransferase family 4 protein, partial [Symploca sp. SIO1A3]|nr:glycosyltransferase family 4 protein [Symploca sp. SIO1A3]